MNEALAIFGFINAALPLIEQLVSGIESLFPQSGQGASKLQTVVGAVQQVAKAANMTETAVANMVPAVQHTVNGIVTLKNATGGFVQTVKSV